MFLLTLFSSIHSACPCPSWYSLCYLVTTLLLPLHQCYVSTPCPIIHFPMITPSIFVVSKGVIHTVTKIVAYRDTFIAKYGLFLKCIQTKNSASPLFTMILLGRGFEQSTSTNTLANNMFYNASVFFIKP